MSPRRRALLICLMTAALGLPAGGADAPLPDTLIPAEALPAR